VSQGMVILGNRILSISLEMERSRSLVLQGAKLSKTLK